MSDEIETFALAKLSLGPRDMVVVKLGGRVHPSVAERVKAHVDRMLTKAGLSNQVLVVDDQIGIEILAASAPASTSPLFDE